MSTVEIVIAIFGVAFTAIFASIALWATLYERGVRTQILKDDNEARKSEAKDRIEIDRANLKLRGEEFEATKKRSDTLDSMLQSRLEHIANIGETLGFEVAKQLRTNPEWAVDVLTRAKFSSGRNSVISLRASHYRDEKLFLGYRFAPMLMERCKQLVLADDDTMVLLLIDSGSTFVPLIESLAEQSVRTVKNEAWLRSKRFRIYTNSLAGADAFMENGREVANDLYSELALDVHILPGKTFATFSTVGGRETEKAVNFLRESHGNNKNVHIISLITGNWLLIPTKENEPSIPIPLARGPGHLPFKQALLDVSDEVYVVAPLGKIFLGAKDANDVNTALGFTANAGDHALEEYKALKIDSKKTNRINLVTTSRPYGGGGDGTRRSGGFLLSKLSSELNAIMHAKESITPTEFAAQRENRPLHLAFPYTKLPAGDPTAEAEIEFPHIHTRMARILKGYFHVPSAVAELFG